MMNNKDTLIAQLQQLNLSADEAHVYLELIKEPSTHLRLSYATGINRTKVYRLIRQLEDRSLVAHRTDDRGTFLVASDPTTLEVALVTEEERLKQQRVTLEHLTRTLTALQTNAPASFVVRTYEGQAGIKQMCWHELKAQGELLALGYGPLEALVADGAWAERHRARQLAARYRVRELVNESDAVSVTALASEKIIQSKLYTARMLPASVLRFDSQTIVYNDTVAIYHWKYDQTVGVEVVSRSYAEMFRQLFNYYWQIAQPFKSLMHE